jgi:hypothetical protein
MLFLPLVVLRELVRARTPESKVRVLWYGHEALILLLLLAGSYR